MASIFRLPGVVAYTVMVFLNAFVDVGHKIIVQNTLFKTLDGNEQIIMTAFLNSLILLPLALLFSPSGFLSDRYSKPHVIRVAAALAVVLTLGITACYYYGNFELAFAMTLLLAIQSAIYSPAKYGYIRELVGKPKLSQGNAVVQSVTIAAILFGTFICSIAFEALLPEQQQNDASSVLKSIAPVGWLLVGASLIELVLAFLLPMRGAASPDLKFEFPRYIRGEYLKKNVSAAYNNNVIWICIVGLAVFWGISQVMVTVFPAHAKASLGESNTIVVQGLLACTGIGIVIGSAIAGKISKNYIETGFIPVGAVGIAVLLFTIPTLQSAITLGMAFILVGICSGFFIVPLNSLIQFHAKESEMARILAANNLFQTLSMLAFLGLTVAASIWSYSSRSILVLIGVVAVVGACYTLYRLPHSLIRFILARAVGSRYKISVLGLENLPSQGGVLLLGNHVSFLDWAIVGIASPRKVRFVMHREYYNRWYLKWFLDLVGCIPISPGRSEKALSTVSESLNRGQVVCLFPEGALTHNGQLGKFKRGFEIAARNTAAVIIPFYIQGMWGSRFSKSIHHGKESQSGTSYNITFAFGEALPIDSVASRVKQAVFELSTPVWDAASRSLGCIAHEWLDTALARPRESAVAELTGKPLTNSKLVAASVLFSKRIRKRSPEQNIGLLLPPGAGGIIANLAVWLCGKAVVNLNYSASPEVILAGIKKADLQSIYTSKVFIRKLKDRGIDLENLLDSVNTYYLEDIKGEIGKVEQLATYAMVRVLPAGLTKSIFSTKVSPESDAAILFSSGSEGTPKGIQLSHRNLLTNVKQVATVLNAQRNDRILGTLPIFHAFGLTATTLLPLIEGLPVICHPDPTDGVNVAKVIAKHKATLMFGTSTFLRLYIRNRRIEPIMFSSIRLVVAGAEKLSPEVVSGFKQRFGKDVYEGFGATETAPVAAVNLPDAIDERSLKVVPGGRPGTVGLPVPGSSFRVVDPETLAVLPESEAGLILISGPQVMKGYLHDEEKTAEAIVEIAGTRWYKTGDKGFLDEDGYLTIVDRYSRFAKIGGEMVSLTAVEEATRKVINNEDVDLVAVTVPDFRKGERIILMVATNQTGLKVDSIKQLLIENKCNPLLLPSETREIDRVPKLGSGKTDFSNAKKLAMEKGQVSNQQ
jgi:acyl-[acyl-carrier-protein]-phospholipid O-acyltransferase/long-chain-fatty-acid--[acyl-carrier-protein] ligase